MLPGRKWVLETQRNYEILIEIYDKDSHKIFPSDVSLFKRRRFASNAPFDHFPALVQTSIFSSDCSTSLSQNVRVDATFDPEYFHVYSPSVNGTYHTVKTLKRGNTVIDGHLRAVLLDVC